MVGQIEQRLVEIIQETYTQNEYWKNSHQIITYLENGDTLSVIKKSYDYDGELLSWTGDFFSYDNENRLSKRNNKLSKNNKKYLFIDKILLLL